MKKSFVFEVQQRIRGEFKCVAKFSSLTEAADFAYRLNLRTREMVYVVRVDIEPVVFFDSYPDSFKTLNKK